MMADLALALVLALQGYRVDAANHRWSDHFRVSDFAEYAYSF
jgi:hypothetical protein